MLTAIDLARDAAGPDGRPRRILALPGRLDIARGAHMLVLGPSGCGKSTLLAVLGGLTRPTGGDVVFEGRSYAALDRRALEALRVASFTHIFQKLHLIGHLTLAQNVALAARARPFDSDWADHLLARLGLTALRDHKAATLSHGEAQRAAIARALLPRPAVLFADEPTSALDDANAQAVMRLLADAAGEGGTTLVVATHDSRIKPFFTHIRDMTP